MTQAEEFKRLYDEQGWVPQSQKTLYDLGVIGMYSIRDEDFLLYRTISFDFEDGSSATYIIDDAAIVCFPQEY